MNLYVVLVILTSFLIRDLEQPIVSYNGTSESSGCMNNTSEELVWRESVRQLSTTALNSFKARQIMSAPMHGATAREKVVNTQSRWVQSALGHFVLHHPRQILVVDDKRAEIYKVVSFILFCFIYVVIFCLFVIYFCNLLCDKQWFFRSTA